MQRGLGVVVVVVAGCGDVEANVAAALVAAKVVVAVIAPVAVIAAASVVVDIAAVVAVACSGTIAGSFINITGGDLVWSAVTRF